MADVRPAVWSEEIDRIIAQGTDAELQTLRGVPGVRFDPVTWEEISTAARGNDVTSLSRVGRNPQQLRVYRQFKEKVGETGSPWVCVEGEKGDGRVRLA